MPTQTGSTTLETGLAEVADGAASPSGCSPISSGRLRSNRLIGASTTRIMMPIAVQAVRQPVCSIMCCTHGSKVTEPMPTPAKAMSNREAAAANEPVRQKQRLAGIAEADAAGADQHADGEIEMPGLRRQRRQQHARLAISATPSSITARGPKRSIIRPINGTDRAGDQEAEREGTGGDAALPAELVDDRRKEQRERRARIDADRHGDERYRDDRPAVEEGKPHRGIFLSVIPFRCVAGFPSTPSRTAAT